MLIEHCATSVVVPGFRWQQDTLDCRMLHAIKNCHSYPMTMAEQSLLATYDELKVVPHGFIVYIQWHHGKGPYAYTIDQHQTTSPWAVEVCHKIDFVGVRKNQTKILIPTELHLIPEFNAGGRLQMSVAQIEWMKAKHAQIT